MSNRHTTSIALGRSAMLVVAALCVFVGHAQSGVGVSPSRIESHVQAGEQISHDVTIDNPGSSPLVVTASLVDAFQGPDGGMIWLEPGSLPNSLAPWLAVSPLQFELAPRENGTVTYTATVPPNTPDGSYWGVLFFESEPPGGAGAAPPGGFGIQSRVRVGHIIYVHVGEIERAGRVDDIGYRAPTTPDAPAAVQLRFQNTGNGILRFGGGIEIRDMDGTLVRELPIAQTASFPGASHDVSAYMDTPLPPGEYLALAVVDFGEATLVTAEDTFTAP